MPHDFGPEPYLLPHLRADLDQRLAEAEAREVELRTCERTPGDCPVHDAAYVAIGTYCDDLGDTLAALMVGSPQLCEAAQQVIGVVLAHSVGWARMLEVIAPPETR